MKLTKSKLQKLIKEELGHMVNEGFGSRASPGPTRVVDHSGKSVRLMECQLGQGLAVELDARLVQTMDEPAVLQVVLHQSRGDAGDPQGAVLALLFLAATERIRPGMKHGLIGLATGVVPSSVEPLGTFEKLLGARLAKLCALDACHDQLL